MSLLKDVALSFIRQKNMFWFACCNIGLFSVLLHQKKVFFQYAAIHSDFHLSLLKRRFSFLLAKLPCFRIVFPRTTFFSVFVTKLHFGHSILPKKCFGLLATKLGYLYPYDTKKSVTFFLCLKYAVFSFIARKTCFGLFSVKLGGFQRYCTGKMFSASLQRVTLIFT